MSPSPTPKILHQLVYGHSNPEEIDKIIRRIFGSRLEFNQVLTGERSLTLDEVNKICSQFGVRPDLFITFK